MSEEEYSSTNQIIMSKEFVHDFYDRELKNNEIILFKNEKYMVRSRYENGDYRLYKKLEGVERDV